MLHRLQNNFFWSGMRKDVQLSIAQCHVCHITKYETKQQANLLQPLHVSTAV